jgi:ketosteroid isomerase-like protein
VDPAAREERVLLVDDIVVPGLGEALHPTLGVGASALGRWPVIAHGGILAGMSQANVDVVRAGHEAMVAGDLERALDSLDPDIEWHGTVGGLDEGSVAHGRDAVVQGFLAYFETWERIELRAERYIDTPGDDVVVFFHEIARGRESGIVVETDTGTVNTVRDGRIVRVRSFMDREEALRVGGVGPNVATVLRIYEAAARRDDVTPFELYAEDIVWDLSNTRAALMYSKPVFHGHEGVREAWREGVAAFREANYSLEELAEPADDHVLAVVREHHVGRASGAPVDASHYAVWTFAGEKVARMQTFEDRADADRSARSS